MKLRVLFFSVLQDITGCCECEMELPSGSGLHDLLGKLWERWPALSAFEASLLFAVDQTYVKRDAMLHDGAEVAIMPPVQGG